MGGADLVVAELVVAPELEAQHAPQVGSQHEGSRRLTST
jgi:hypothetical protein